MYFILCVLHAHEHMEEVLDAWEEAGVGGVTILPSMGLKRYRDKAALRDDMPLIPGLDDLLDRYESSNRTLFTVVKDDAMVDQVVAATERITGSLDLPNTGILVVLPVVRAYGLHRRE